MHTRYAFGNSICRLLARRSLGLRGLADAGRYALKSLELVVHLSQCADGLHIELVGLLSVLETVRGEAVHLVSELGDPLLDLVLLGVFLLDQRLHLHQRLPALRCTCLLVIDCEPKLGDLLLEVGPLPCSVVLAELQLVYLASDALSLLGLGDGFIIRLRRLLYHRGLLPVDVAHSDHTCRSSHTSPHLGGQPSCERAGPLLPARLRFCDAFADLLVGVVHSLLVSVEVCLCLEGYVRALDGVLEGFRLSVEQLEGGHRSAYAEGSYGRGEAAGRSGERLHRLPTFIAHQGYLLRQSSEGERQFLHLLGVDPEGRGDVREGAAAELVESTQLLLDVGHTLGEAGGVGAYLSFEVRTDS